MAEQKTQADIEREAARLAGTERAAAHLVEGATPVTLREAAERALAERMAVIDRMRPLNNEITLLYEEETTLRKMADAMEWNGLVDTGSFDSRLRWLLDNPGTAHRPARDAWEVMVRQIGLDPWSIGSRTAEGQKSFDIELPWNRPEAVQQAAEGLRRIAPMMKPFENGGMMVHIKAEGASEGLGAHYLVAPLDLSRAEIHVGWGRHVSKRFESAVLEEALDWARNNMPHPEPDLDGDEPSIGP